MENIIKDVFYRVKKFFNRLAKTLHRVQRKNRRQTAQVQLEARSAPECKSEVQNRSAYSIELAAVRRG